MGRCKVTMGGRDASERPALAVGLLAATCDGIQERRRGRRQVALPRSQHDFWVFPGHGGCSRTTGSQNRGQDKPPSHSL